MQQELEADFPEYDIQIIGINEAGHEIGNPAITDGRDLPWLQDVDSDGNKLSDVWRDKWEITYRDVFVLNQSNEVEGIYNLTIHDLANEANYSELRDMLVDAAMASEADPYMAGDANRDFSFDQFDLVQVMRARKYDTGEAADWEEGDWNGDGLFNRLDVVAALATGNYLAGPYFEVEG
jgi:hypothetical protein